MHTSQDCDKCGGMFGRQLVTQLDICAAWHTGSRSSNHLAINTPQDFSERPFTAW
jgi:hypothetical protein